MIHVRRAVERHRLSSASQDVWLSFFPSLRSDPLAGGFGELMALNEGFLKPEGHMLSYSRQGTKTITYVVEGLLSQKHRCHRSVLIRAGDFQCSSAEFCDCSIHANASSREPLHMLQISLFPRHHDAAAPEPQSRNFAQPSGGGALCLVGSAEGRDGSLALGQDALIYSGLLAPQQSVLYPTNASRVTWLQVLHGQVTVNATALRAGDGAGFSSVAALSLEATTEAEIMLLDLPGQPHHERRRPRAEDDHSNQAVAA